MRISLQELVELTSSMVGKPFDIPIQEQLKTIFNYKRADWMQKVIDKHPEQRKYFLKYITDALEDVEEAECPAQSTGCTVRRTSKIIPLPIRSQYALFDYVGDTDKTDGYTYVTPDQLLWMIKYGSKYTKDRPKWSYLNGRVYLYNDNYIDDLTMGGIWPDQRQLNPFKCDDQPCYKDTDQYDIPDDIINTMMQDVIKNELKLLLPPDETEVTLDEDK